MIIQLSREGEKLILLGVFIYPLLRESSFIMAFRKEVFPLATGPTIATKVPG